MRTPHCSPVVRSDAAKNLEAGLLVRALVVLRVGRSIIPPNGWRLQDESRSLTREMEMATSSDMQRSGVLRRG
jgi:hypothetical protein